MHAMNCTRLDIQMLLEILSGFKSESSISVKTLKLVQTPNFKIMIRLLLP